MARLLSVHLARERVPARAALQKALGELGFALTLDEGYEPFGAAGYLPCTLDGEDAGFDLRFAALDAAQQSEGRDTLMSLRWGGDPREQASALAVAAALAQRFGAQVADDAGPRDAAHWLDTARRAMAAL